MDLCVCGLTEVGKPNLNVGVTSRGLGPSLNKKEKAAATSTPFPMLPSWLQCDICLSLLPCLLNMGGGPSAVSKITLPFLSLSSLAVVTATGVTHMGSRFLRKKRGVQGLLRLLRLCYLYNFPLATEKHMTSTDCREKT